MHWAKYTKQNNPKWLHASSHGHLSKMQPHKQKCNIKIVQGNNSGFAVVTPITIFFSIQVVPTTALSGEQRENAWVSKPSGQAQAQWLQNPEGRDCGEGVGPQATPTPKHDGDACKLQLDAYQGT